MQVGYGDLYPTNDLERFFVLLAMLFGVITFLLNFIPNLGAAIATVSGGTKKYLLRLSHNPGLQLLNPPYENRSKIIPFIKAYLF